MKKILLVVMLNVIGVFTYAQTVQGSKVLGGGVSYETMSYRSFYNDKAKISSISFVPSFGYFVADNLAVGANLSILSSTDSDDGEGAEVQYTEFGIGPFVRWYRPTSSENFSFFVQGSVMYFSGKETYDFNDIEVSSGAFSIAVSPGFAYFFNEHWSAELAFRGITFSQRDPNKDVDDNNVTTFGIGLMSLSPSLGVRYYF